VLYSLGIIIIISGTWGLAPEPGNSEELKRISEAPMSLASRVQIYNLGRDDHLRPAMDPFLAPPPSPSEISRSQLSDSIHAVNPSVVVDMRSEPLIVLRSPSGSKLDRQPSPQSSFRLSSRFLKRHSSTGPHSAPHIRYSEPRFLSSENGQTVELATSPEFTGESNQKVTPSPSPKSATSAFTATANGIKTLTSIPSALTAAFSKTDCPYQQIVPSASSTSLCPSVIDIGDVPTAGAEDYSILDEESAPTSLESGDAALLDEESVDIILEQRSNHSMDTLSDSELDLDGQWESDSSDDDQAHDLRSSLVSNDSASARIPMRIVVTDLSPSPPSSDSEDCGVDT